MVSVTNKAFKVVIVADSGTMRALMYGLLSDRMGFDVVGIAKEADEALGMVGRTGPDLVTIDLSLPYIDGSRLLAMLRDRAGLVKLVMTAASTPAVKARLRSLGASDCLDKAELLNDPAAFRAGLLAAIRRHGPSHAAGCRDGSGGVLIDAAHRFPVPPDEAGRLATVAALGAARSSADACLDMIARQLTGETGYPIAAVNVIDAANVWTRAAAGVARGCSGRAEHLCAHAICQAGPLVVSDATRHPSFARLPVVLGEPYVRAYVGVPIVVDAQPVGAVCVADTKPRQPGRAQVAAVARAATFAAEFLADQVPGRLVA